MITRDDHYYLQPLTDVNKLVVLDIRDPLHPDYLAMDGDDLRLAVSDYVLDIPSLVADGDRWIYLLNFDRATGAVGFDPTFRDEFTGNIGIEFNRETWPHGKSGPARPHGLLFLP
ncbi:MAG: hypothetical protein NVS9B13_18800 [Candidatus Acidiferrum sp.]